jgi:hypothetical protein
MRPVRLIVAAVLVAASAAALAVPTAGGHDRNRWLLGPGIAEDWMERRLQRVDRARPVVHCRGTGHRQRGSGGGLIYDHFRCSYTQMCRDRRAGLWIRRGKRTVHVLGRRRFKFEPRMRFRCPSRMPRSAR